MSPVSFTTRSGRMTDGQQRAWNTRQSTYLVDVPRHHAYLSVDPQWRFDAAAEFGRTAPLVLEIGSGQGDAIVAEALRDPERDYLAVEVYLPGVAQTMVRADRAFREDGTVSDDGTAREAGNAAQTLPAEPEDPGLANLRVAQVNAAEFLDTAVPEGSLDELWTFFPDPWHKLRHRKRRLVTPVFADKVARVLRPGGVWRLATDWSDYATQMFDVLDASTHFENAHGDRTPAPRFEGRIVTGFERKAHRAGREITDLTYVRA